MLGLTTASRLTPIQQMSLAVLSRTACASMSTMMTTTTHDRGPLWPHGMGPAMLVKLEEQLASKEELYVESISCVCM